MSRDEPTYGPLGRRVHRESKPHPTDFQRHEAAFYLRKRAVEVRRLAALDVTPPDARLQLESQAEAFDRCADELNPQAIEETA